MANSLSKPSTCAEPNCMGIDKRGGGLGLTLLPYTVNLYEISKRLCEIPKCLCEISKCLCEISKCLCEISKCLHMAVIALLKLIMFAYVLTI